MNDFNEFHLRPYNQSRSEAMQRIIARNIGPRLAGPPPGPHTNARTSRFALGAAKPPALPKAPGEVPELPPPAGPLPPLGPPTEPQQVWTGWGGAGVHYFHFFGATAGGTGNNEIRVSELLPYYHFETKGVWITPYSGVTAGQFIQLLWSPDNDIAPTATPTGTPIGQGLGRLGDNPTGDNNRAIPVPSTPMFIDTFRTGAMFEGYLKVRLFFAAPAIALPVISVGISVYYDAPGQKLLYAVRS